MEMADSYLNIAAAYINKKEGLNALKNLVIADSIIEKFNYLSAKIASFKTYSEYYKLESNYEKAFASLQKANALTDSLAIANKQIDESNFVETEVEPAGVKTEASKFPFLYLNIFILLIILSAVFVLRYKR